MYTFVHGCTRLYKSAWLCVHICHSVVHTPARLYRCVCTPVYVSSYWYRCKCRQFFEIVFFSLFTRGLILRNSSPVVLSLHTTFVVHPCIRTTRNTPEKSPMATGRCETSDIVHTGRIGSGCSSIVV